MSHLGIDKLALRTALLFFLVSAPLKVAPLLAQARKVKKLFQSMNLSGDGAINFQEFAKLVESPKIQFWRLRRREAAEATHTHTHTRRHTDSPWRADTHSHRHAHTHTDTPTHRHTHTHTATQLHRAVLGIRQGVKQWVQVA